MATSLVSKINTSVALLKGWVNSFLAFMGQVYIGFYINGLSVFMLLLLLLKMWVKHYLLTLFLQPDAVHFT
jgi:hypothetical protein